VTYTKGEQCGWVNYSTKIYVNCQDGADPGFFYDVDENDECAVTLYMYSAAGCGKSYSSSSSSSSSASYSSSTAAPAPDEFCEAVLTKDGSSYLFDLRALNHGPSATVDTLWYRTSDNDIYYINFCGQTAAPCNDDDTSVCLRVHDSGDYKYINAGSTSTQEFSITHGLTFGKSITVTYSDGAKCGMGTKKTHLVVNCQDGATPGYFYDMEEISECESTLYMYSSAGCGAPVNPSSSSSSNPSTSSSSHPSSSSSSHASSSSSSSPSPTPIPTGFCGVTLSDERKKISYKYDLSSLYHDNSTLVDQFFFINDDHNIFFVNFCGQSAANCSKNDTSVCIDYTDEAKYVSGGSTSTQSFASAEGRDIDQGVTVTYSNGGECGAGRKKVTHIVVACEKYAVPGYIYDYKEIDECEGILYMWSSAGCGENVPYVDPHH